MIGAVRRYDLGVCALGRTIDAAGMPLDERAPLRGRRVPIVIRPPRPSQRAPIILPLWSGIRVVDGLLTIGRGARVGIFGAPGSGKSVFVEDIVAGCEADAVVVALVGERGREAQRWIARCDARTTIVCATSDRPARERIAAARLAAVQADALRERGLHVVLVIDSLARVASALRETAVATGESAGRGGYPPSVFANLAQLLEVAGELFAGSMTLIATVLSDGDDRDPVSEAARSLLDGHIALSTSLAHAGRFPAVDVLRSASRTMEGVADTAHARAARRVRSAIAELARTEDARSLGIEPVERSVLAAIAAEPRMDAFLRQPRVLTRPNDMLEQLYELEAVLPADDAHR